MCEEQLLEGINTIIVFLSISSKSLYLKLKGFSHPFSLRLKIFPKSAFIILLFIALGRFSNSIKKKKKPNDSYLPYFPSNKKKKLPSPTTDQITFPILQKYPHHLSSSCRSSGTNTHPFPAARVSSLHLPAYSGTTF